MSVKAVSLITPLGVEMLPLPVLRSPCHTADALRIMIASRERVARWISLVRALAVAAQRLFDGFAVESAAHEQRVETLALHPWIEPSVPPRGLFRHPAREPHLVGRAERLFEARERAFHVVSRDTPPPELLLEPAPPRGAAAPALGEERERVFRVVHETDGREPVEH